MRIFGSMDLIKIKKIDSTVLWQDGSTKEHDDDKELKATDKMCLVTYCNHVTYMNALY